MLIQFVKDYGNKLAGQKCRMIPYIANMLIKDGYAVSAAKNVDIPVKGAGETPRVPKQDETFEPPKAYKVKVEEPQKVKGKRGRKPKK